MARYCDYEAGKYVSDFAAHILQIAIGVEGVDCHVTRKGIISIRYGHSSVQRVSHFHIFV